jgi:hypothetical protein
MITIKIEYSTTVSTLLTTLPPPLRHSKNDNKLEQSDRGENNLRKHKQ